MERRAYYKNGLLPWLLLAPQLILVLVFFYWPTSQALFWAFTLEQPWGGGNTWVGLDNFLAIFRDREYWTTVVRSGFYALVQCTPSLACLPKVPWSATDDEVIWQWFEQFSAIHNQPIATLGNGFGGLEAEMVVSKGAFVDQLTWIKAMYDEGLLIHKSKDAGQTANDAFTAGDCQITSSSVADHGTFGKQAKEGVHWTNAMLPMRDGFERHNSFVGGASLWTLKGKSAEEYKGAAAFYAFLAKPEQAKWWSTVTGYIPVTNTGFEAMQAEGFYAEAPYKGRELAIESLNMPAGENTKGIRLGSYASIRAEMVKTMQAVLFNNVPVQQALEEFDAKGNEILRRFEATYAGKSLL